MLEESEPIYCEICASKGKTSKIKVYQINFDEATKICENEDCTYPFGLQKSSGAIINRKFTDIANITRKKEIPQQPPRPTVHRKPVSVPHIVCQRPSTLPSLKSAIPNKPLAPYIPGKSLPLERKNSEIQHVPSLKLDKVETENTSNISDILQEETLLKSLHLSDRLIYPQWQNKDALCWLDVVMCLFVHNKRLQKFIAIEKLTSLSVLVTLVKAYEQAFQLFNSHKANTTSNSSHQNIQTCSDVDVISDNSMDADICSGKPSSICKDVVGDFKRLSVDEDCVKTGAGFHLSNSDFLSVATAHGETRYSKALEMLHNVRESTWKSIQPRLRCRKGQNDSPVFAIPLLTKDNKTMEKLFSMGYSFTLTCSHCGHTKTDHYEKVLPTFPNTSKDFNMAAPAFVRPCFQCETPNQRRVMVYDKLSEIVMLHFVEGLPHNDFKRLSFSYLGNIYAVTGLIQYRNDPDHFVAWIRDPNENVWMECDDLKSPVTSYLSSEPVLPASQIHVVMWELQSPGSTLQGAQCGSPMSPMVQQLDVSMVPQLDESEKVVTSKIPKPNVLYTKLVNSNEKQSNNVNLVNPLLLSQGFRPIAQANGSVILIANGQNLINPKPLRAVPTAVSSSQTKLSASASVKEHFISKTKSNVDILRSIRQKRAKQNSVVVNNTNLGNASSVRPDISKKVQSTSTPTSRLKTSASESSFQKLLPSSAVSTASQFNWKGKVFAGYKSRNNVEEMSRASSPVSDTSSRCSSPALSTSSDGVIVQKRKTEVSAKLEDGIKRRKSTVSYDDSSNQMEADDKLCDGHEENGGDSKNSECQILQGLYSALNIPLPEKAPSDISDLGSGEKNSTLCNDLPEVLELAQFINCEENCTTNIDTFLSEL